MSRTKLDEIWLEDTDNKLYRRINGGWVEVSPSTGGSGEGAINYAQNPVEADSLAYITYSGVTPAWSTTHNLFGGGALRCNMTSSGTGRYMRIALDDLSDAQITEMLRLSFFYKIVTGGDDAVRVSIWDGTNHVYFAPEYLVAASGEITKYDGWCYSISKTGHYLQFSFKDSTAIDFYIASVSFVPRVLPQGAVMTEWQSYTMGITGTVTNPTPGTIVQNKAQWRRVGSSIEVRIDFETSTAGSAGSGTYMFSLPPGIAANESKIPAINAGAGLDCLPAGIAYIYNSAPNSCVTAQVAVYSQTAGQPKNQLVVYCATSFSPYSITAVSSGHFALNAPIRYHLIASFPVLGWTSSINLVTDCSEYASNSSSTDANDTTSFVYGPQGSTGIIGVTNLSLGRVKRVEFKTAIQPTDLIKVELQAVGSDAWVDLPIRLPSTHVISPHFAYVNAEGGIVWNAVPGNNKQLDIIFLMYPSGVNSYGWGYSGFAGIKWRVRKISNGNMAEAPASGIYESGQNANGYYVKYVDGTMECWGGLAVSGLSNGSVKSLVFPATFAGGNYQTIIISPKMCHASSGGGYTTVVDSSVTNTGFSVGIWAPPPASYITYHAIGKWNLSRSVVAPGTPVGASTVFAYYKRNATTTSGNVVDFNILVEDALNTVTTGASWRFTAPVSGLYQVILTGVPVVYTNGRLDLRKNGTLFSSLAICSSTHNDYLGGETVVIRLNQGDYINLYASGNQTVFSSSNGDGIQIIRLST